MAKITPEITILRCDPIDQQAALARLGIGDRIWSLSQNVNAASDLDRLAQPIREAMALGGRYIWKNYLTALSALDPIGQQIIWDLFHELYFRELASPCAVTILQTDLTPIPTAIAYFVNERVVPLPTISEIQEILQRFNLAPDDRLIRLSAGLSHADLAGCLQRLAIDLDPHAQIEQFRSKRLALKGIEYAPPPTYREIGGLDLLAKAIEDLQFRLSPAAEELGLPSPRGWLFAGVPGTGKTFAAKAIAAQLGYPMFSLRLDFLQAGGAILLKNMLEIVECCAPCILFVDEIEKLFRDNMDGRILATLLSWLNDKTAKVFAIGTLNRIAQMPIEMTRAGRFDRIFFIDSPDEGQRVELCRLFLKRYDPRFANADDPVFTPLDWQYFADATIEFIGAEIQQVVQDSIARVYRENPHAQIAIDDLLVTATRFKSMYRRDPRQILEIRNTLSDKADPASSGSRRFLPDRKIDIYAPVH